MFKHAQGFRGTGKFPPNFGQNGPKAKAAAAAKARKKAIEKKKRRAAARAKKRKRLRNYIEQYRPGG